ncbi:hypothetical protein ACT4ML_05475 [Natrinema sp. LN54]|uniref:hypothetical protein n=1 Tax=Natrinema sp. LN54 TaxID=3458705 RepID=UPI00403599AA
MSIWRLYGGRVWEALGWLAWVGAAGTLVFGLVGVFLLIGGRAGYLRDVWRVDSTARKG